MNLKILIVEDEPPIARSLRTLIEQLPDMTVVACAIHGVDALEWLEREAIDVVFTDVSMPVMGGIELMSAIHERYPDIVTVVVSGYQDFEYVRSALRYQAFDYMLKPVFKPDLHKLLGSLEEASFDRKRERQERTERQLHDLLNRTGSSWPPLHNSVPNMPWYTVAVICAGTLPGSYADKRSPARDYWGAVDLSVLLPAQLPANQGDNRYWVLDGKSAAEKIIVCGSMEEQDRTLLEQVYAQLPRDLFVTMAVGPAVARVEELAEMHDALRMFLYRTISIEQSQLRWVQQSELQAVQSQSHEKGILLDSAESESLVLHLNWAEAEPVEQILRQLFGRCMEQMTSQAELESLMLQILHRVSKFSAGQDVNLSELEIEIGEAMTSASSYPVLLEEVVRIFVKTSSRHKAQDTPRIVLDVEQYLQENYAQAITNEDLSKKFGFVPSYITKLYRTHRGMSPSQYMTRIRLEKAKEIMRSQPELMLKEIAEMVGYNDPLYFSRVFHKEVGIWPSEYKQG